MDNSVSPTSTVKLIRLPINYTASILTEKPQNVEDTFDSILLILLSTFHTVLEILNSFISNNFFKLINKFYPSSLSNSDLDFLIKASVLVKGG